MLNNIFSDNNIQKAAKNAVPRRLFRAVCAFALAMLLFLCFSGCSAVSSLFATPPPADEAHTCTLYIECTKILENMDDFDSGKLDVLPEDGIILQKVTVNFNEGDSVYDVLVRETSARGIHMEANYTPVYESAYIEGIHNIYEFDCGEGSGWTYCVNGVFPNYGCSKYPVNDGDVIEWHYTCDFGRDVGAPIGG
ncbi:MAG: DUF4430 domain-containing protein [Clostridia bacterium]|nr:DUF4430 domain-containing protein [Clostridia bacterium]